MFGVKNEYRWKAKHADVSIKITINEYNGVVQGIFAETSIKTSDGQHFCFNCVGIIAEDSVGGFSGYIEGNTQVQHWEDVDVNLTFDCSMEGQHSDNDWPELDELVGPVGDVFLLLSGYQVLNFEDCGSFDWKLRPDSGEGWIELSEQGT